MASKNWMSTSLCRFRQRCMSVQGAAEHVNNARWGYATQTDCTLEHSHTPHEQRAGYQKPISHQMDRLKNSSIASLQPQGKTWNGTKKRPLQPEPMCHLKAGKRLWLKSQLSPAMAATTQISSSGLGIHTLCDSEQVSIDGFLLWHRGCSSSAQLCSQSRFKKFPPWIPHCSLLVPGSAPQLLVPFTGRRIYHHTSNWSQPQSSPVTHFTARA